MADEFALQMAAIKASVPATFRFRDEGLCLIGVWHGGVYAWRGSHLFTVMRPHRKRTAAHRVPETVYTRPRAQCYGRLAIAVERLATAMCNRHCVCAGAPGSHFCCRPNTCGGARGFRFCCRPKPCGGARSFRFCCRPRLCGPPRATCPSTLVSTFCLPPTIPATPHAIAPTPGCLRAMPLRFTTVLPIAVWWGVCELELVCGVPLQRSNVECVILISPRLCSQVVASSIL